MLSFFTGIKERNEIILHSIEEGESQHRIATVLGVTLQDFLEVLKRIRA